MNENGGKNVSDSESIESKDKSSSHISFTRIFFPFLIEDVIYAILPILVLAGIEFHFYNKIGVEFLKLSAWSFANIVLYGTTIRRVIKLKLEIREYQERSYVINTIVQLLIFLVIASVLILSLIILVVDKNKFSAEMVPYLSYAQITLFIIAVLSVLLSYIWEDYYYKIMRKVPKIKNMRRFLASLYTKLYKAEKKINEMSVLLIKISNITAKRNSAKEHENSIDNIISSLERIISVLIKTQVSLSKIKENLEKK